MEDVKVCPECGAEYFAHVASCRACEVELVCPGEKAHPEKKPRQEEDPLVCIEEGALDKAKGVHADLKSLGFDSKVLNVGGGVSCSSAVYGVFVNQSAAGPALKRLEELLHKRHPELKVMEEKISDGRCPACGSPLYYAVYECPECGLNLGGGGHMGGGGCGDCGPC